MTAWLADMLNRGSPPLARGNPTCQGLESKPPRFTPARAGKSHLPANRLLQPVVHPRSRGEIDTCWNIQPYNSGFTPARAGKSWGDFAELGRRRVHPRSRGEILR